MLAWQMYYAYEGNVDADIYWSNLDNSFNADNDNRWDEEGDSGFDLYAGLYIGRVTCDVPQDVSNWLTKSVYYTQSDWGVIRVTMPLEYSFGSTTQQFFSSLVFHQRLIL